MPPAGDRAPFGRLEGIVRYPDVPFVDDNGDVVTSVRTSNPPTEPPVPPDTGDTLARLVEMGAYRDWLDLGFGDDDDAYEVRIGRVEPADALDPSGEAPA